MHCETIDEMDEYYKEEANKLADSLAATTDSEEQVVTVESGSIINTISDEKSDDDNSLINVMTGMELESDEISSEKNILSFSSSSQEDI
ncbi:hypothetical protein AB6A40_001349 [Gnathostoma spinigerum]|uniref:Uncharacterized protein n=1 Tax=Gnathostoma spinigerum TaxID=75299 RepID=A0ABD6EE92_9BILA